MAVVRGQFEDLLVPGAKQTFTDDYAELPAIYPNHIPVETSGRAFEDDLVTTGLPIAVEKPEGEDIAMDRPKFRGKVRYTHAGYGLGYEITREAVEDELYGVLTSQGSSNLAWSLREAEEITAHDIFNLAFTTLQTYDSVSLINTAHVGVAGLTFSNRAAGDEDIAVSSLKAASERFMDRQTDRGLRITIMPSDVLVNHNNFWTMTEILGTEWVNQAVTAGEISSDRTINVVSSRMNLMPHKSQFITDDDAWYMMAPKAQRNAKFYWRRRPDPVSGSEDRRDVAWFGITARWSVGATDWRWIDGSPGT